jgi:crossover junction endodeoxyribonuclease RuvC
MGIDPGSRITGYGIVGSERKGITHIHHGEIKSKRNEPLSDCLKGIYDGLRDIIETYTPDAIAVEDIFYGKNIKSLVKLGHVRGAAILAASHSAVPVFEYAPLEVKKAVVGYGRAEKLQVQKMVTAILGLHEVPPTDASDALAIAICHTNYLKVLPV